MARLWTFLLADEVWGLKQKNFCSSGSCGSEDFEDFRSIVVTDQERVRVQIGVQDWMKLVAANRLQKDTSGNFHAKRESTRAFKPRTPSTKV